MDSGTYDDMGLYIYYILNDFGSYIGWFGVTVAAGAVAWMGLKERSIPLWIGIVSCVPVLAVLGFTGGTGLPGFPGVVSQIWMVVAFAGLGLHRTFARA
jgi:purine-cytosine permease-like protein